jgi:hypothetical protein
MKRKPRQVLGHAPPGFSCALCGQGGNDVVQIAMPRGCTGFMHRACAQEFFGEPVLESMKPKNRKPVLDRESVDGICR